MLKRAFYQFWVHLPTYSSPRIIPLIVFKATNLSIKHGNSLDSIVAYYGYGLALCGVIGDIENGFEFGKLALELYEKFNVKSLESRVRMLSSTMKGC